MVDDSTAGTPSAASPATDGATRETEVLSGLTKLALEMARTFQAQSLAALAAGDLDRAGKAEARFSSLFLAIRRAAAIELRRRGDETLAAASPAEDEAAMLSELMELALELARTFQARALAALAADDLDRAGDAEARFSSLFLGIRRAIALQARLRQQREKAQHEAAFRRKTRQDEKDSRRHAVARGVAAAIAAVPDAEAQERLTADLWDRLTEDERIDVDLADTALPIGALIVSLCRALGLPPRGTPPAGGPAPAAKTAADGAGPKGQASDPASTQPALKRDRCTRAAAGWRTNHPSEESSGSWRWRRPPRGPPTGREPR